MNNVGWTAPAFFLEQDVERWDRIWAINLRSVLACSHAALAHMRERRTGCVVSIASDAAFGEPRQSDYGAAKAGVVSLSKSLAREFGRYGIRPQRGRPRPRTAGGRWRLGEDSLWRHMPFSDEQLAAIRRDIPLDRFTTPADVAAAVLFFASDVTGRQLTDRCSASAAAAACRPETFRKE